MFEILYWPSDCKNNFWDFFLQITEAVNLKRIRETLKKENRYILCNNSSDCLDYVKNGNAAYGLVNYCHFYIIYLLKLVAVGFTSLASEICCGNKFAISIIQTTNSLSILMAADVKLTGTCQFTKTKENFWNSATFTLLQKNSPYTETMSRGYNQVDSLCYPPNYQNFDSFIFWLR